MEDIKRNFISDDTGNAIALKKNPFVLTGGEFLPGEAELFCENQEDDAKRTMCVSELLYYRGKPAETRRQLRKIGKPQDAESIAARYIIDTITAIYLGDIDIINSVNFFLGAADFLNDMSAEDKMTVEFAKLFLNILTHNRAEINFPPVNVHAFAVPDELLPVAVYAYAHYLVINGDYSRAIGLAEGMLINIKGSHPIGEIYLSLIISCGYICRAEWKKAEYYFRNAWEKALPDKFFLPFAEHRIMLSGLLEKCLKKDYPAEYKKISELSVVYHKNWVYIHNELTGEHVTDKLTLTEMNVAGLASTGLSNTEISEFLEISVNSVRAHLRNIFGKLDITSRKELSNYIIK